MSTVKYTRDHEWILNGIVYDQRKIHFIIRICFVTVSRYIHGKGLTLVVAAVYHYAVFKPGFFAQNSSEGLRK